MLTEGNDSREGISLWTWKHTTMLLLLAIRNASLNSWFPRLTTCSLGLESWGSGGRTKNQARGFSSKIPIPYRFPCRSTSDFEGIMCSSNLGQLPASSQTSCFKMWKPFLNFPTTFTLAQNHSVTLNNLLLSLSRQLLLKDNLNHLMPEDGDILVISGQVNQFIGNNY